VPSFIADRFVSVAGREGLTTDDGGVPLDAAELISGSLIGGGIGVSS